MANIMDEIRLSQFALFHAILHPRLNLYSFLTPTTEDAYKHHIEEEIQLKLKKGDDKENNNVPML